MELGVKQRFSNIEHPWENGKAERSFQTLFTLARSLLKHADLPDKLWGKAILHSAYLTNRSPTASLGGIAPLQFRTKEAIDLTHMRVFEAQLKFSYEQRFVKTKNFPTDQLAAPSWESRIKATDTSFLSKNHTNSSKWTLKTQNLTKPLQNAGKEKETNKWAYIDPDLTNEKENEIDETNSNENSSDEEKDDLQHERPKRMTTQRQFLLPGTHSKQVRFEQHNSAKEIEIRKQQYSNLLTENLTEDAGAIFIMNCVESQIDEEMKLMRELELLSACIYNNEDNEILLATIKNENEINLMIPDPKSQNDINKIEPKDAKRFNEATITEVNGMKHKGVIEYTTLNDLPKGTKIYQSIVNWTSKTNLGVYIKTKCRICFGGHRYDKSYSDTFAPTVNFCTVLMMICLSAMFGWYMGSLDYSQAYLNADIDELCVMRAPISVRV
jgi:hypothetical protein